MKEIEDLIKHILESPVLYLVLCMLLFFIFRKATIYFRNKKLEKQNHELNRDIVIDVNYNPSVLGILVDNEINDKELLADIMNLYSKKIINIEKDENLQRYNLKLINSSVEITESDKYIIKTLVVKEEKFQFFHWRKLVIEQSKQLNFIETYDEVYSKSKNEKIKSDFYKIIIPFIIYFFSAIISWVLVSIITFNPLESLRNNARNFGDFITICSCSWNSHGENYNKQNRENCKIN